MSGLNLDDLVVKSGRSVKLIKEEINFYKVSYEQFEKDWIDTFGNKSENIKEIYDSISIPKRATFGSAAYDFYCPLSKELKVGETIKIPTGIKAAMPQWVGLFLLPRSGLGFKYRLQLNNTIGLVDSDYITSDNEGHIFIKLTNDSNEHKVCNLEKGKGFAQGVFLPVLFTSNDSEQTKGHRNGGFGSTD